MITGIFIPYDQRQLCRCFDFDDSSSEVLLKSLRELIGCEILDFLTLPTMLKNKRCLVIDDNGKLRDDWLLTVNSRATFFFQLLSHSDDMIAGNAILFDCIDGDICSPFFPETSCDLLNSL